MRLFIAVDLPAAVKDQVEALRAPIPGAAWVRREALHLTLQFLGDGIPDARLPELVTALRDVSAPAFTMAVEGSGHFPPGQRQPPRVLWVGLAAPRELADLYRAVTRVTGPLGFPPDRRGFSPHITVARLKQPDAGPQVESFVRRHADLRSAPFAVNEFILFSSVLSAGGSHYTRAGVFPLR